MLTRTEFRGLYVNFVRNVYKNTKEGQAVSSHYDEAKAKFFSKERDCKFISYKDYSGYIIRNPHTFSLCGYIAITEFHPWYRKNYDEIDCSVHGGLTFSDDSLLNESSRDNETWYIGFDCVHVFDIMPLTKIVANLDSFPQEHYRDMNYVTQQIKSLIDQAIEVKDKQDSKLRIQKRLEKRSVEKLREEVLSPIGTRRLRRIT